MSKTIIHPSIAAGSQFKNRIINGDMRIDQRNAGAAVTINTTSARYASDRWQMIGQSADGVYTAQNFTPGPSGHPHYQRLTVTTADASIGASQQYRLGQLIEGSNLMDLAWGSSSAKPITLSFWIRSSLTGTFGGCLQNELINRSYVFTFAINSANVWEYKTITIQGDTSGTWNLDVAAIGVRVYFSLGMGSDFYGTAGSWSGSNIRTVSGETKFIGTLNATLDFTGMQFETGVVASDFERRSFTDELTLCERFFTKTYGYGVSPGTATGGGLLYRAPGVSLNYSFYAQYRVRMFQTPVLTIYSYAGASGNMRNINAGSDVAVSSVVANHTGGFAGFTSGTNSVDNNEYGCHFTADAEA